MSKTKISYEIEPPKKEQLNKNGNNTLIKVRSDVTEQKLKDYGFTNHNPERYYWMRMINDVLSMSVTIDKETLSVLEVDVLDERFLQPYDYQANIMSGSFDSTDRCVFKRVSKELNKMQDAKIIEGYKRGMYV